MLSVTIPAARRADPARSGSSETPHYGAHRTWTESAAGRLTRPRSRVCVPLENERLIAKFLQFKTSINYRENQRWIQKINAVPVASFRYRLILTQEPPRLLAHQPLTTKCVESEIRARGRTSRPFRACLDPFGAEPAATEATSCSVLVPSKVGSCSAHPKPVELNQRS